MKLGSISSKMSELKVKSLAKCAETMYCVELWPMAQIEQRTSRIRLNVIDSQNRFATNSSINWQLDWDREGAKHTITIEWVR